MSAAPGRDPCGLLNGALRLQIISIYRASSGLRWICDHERRRNEIRKGLEILPQAAGFENRMGPSGFVKAP